MLRSKIVPTVNRSLLAALFAAGTLALAGCDGNDGPAEEAGDEVGDAVDGD